MLLIIVFVFTATLVQFSFAQLTDLEVVRETLRTRYVRTVPDSILNLDSINLIIKALNDPFTYVAIPEATEYLEDYYGASSMDLGIDLDNSGDSIPVVCEVMYGSPAYFAGLCVNDTVYEIDNVTMRPKHWIEGMNAILSSKEDEVKINVHRGTNWMTFYVPRKSRDNPGFAYYVDNHIAYIRVTHFGRSTGWSMLRLFLELKAARIRRIVMDLRPCGGGNLQSALQILRAFASEGDSLMRTCYRGDSVEYTLANADGMFNGKLLEVIVGKGTASAAEVIAVAVQENEYGYVMGDSTSGKGKMQHQFALPSGSWFQFTNAILKGPHGLCVDKEYGTGGLVPTMTFNTGNVSFDTLRSISGSLRDLDEVRIKYPEADSVAIQLVRESLPDSLQNIGVYYIARCVWGEQARLWFLSQQPRYARWKKPSAIVRSTR